MASTELVRVSTDVEFGRGEGLWCYNMARSLRFDLDDRPIDLMADDAVKTAVRQFDRRDICIPIAREALVHALAPVHLPSFELTEN